MGKSESVFLLLHFKVREASLRIRIDVAFVLNVGFESKFSNFKAYDPQLNQSCVT